MIKDELGMAYSKGSISIIHQIEGNINSGYEIARESLMLAKERGDAFIKGMAYPAYGSACYQKGLFDEARTYLLEYMSSYEKAGPISWMGWAYTFLGSVYTDSKAYDEAINIYKRAISIWEDAMFSPSFTKYFHSCVMKVKVLKHDQDIELSELFSCYEDYKLTWGKGSTARNIGDVLLNMDENHYAEAGTWFQKAIKDDAENAIMWEMARDHAAYADWFRKKGDVQGARDQLTRAIDLFKECGADGWVEKYEKELAGF
jgi:tetratricopeptide (TPR) repeat protein